MIRILIIIILLSSCGKKGELSLDNEKLDNIIQIEEERIFKF